MKRILYVFMCFMLVLSACNKEESVIDDSAPATQEGPMHFYGVKYPVADENTISQKAVAQNSKKWIPGSTIKIKFLNGDYGQQQKVMKYASEWFPYVNLRFESKIAFSGPATPGNPEVRIAFDSDTKFITWSYTGTDCKSVTDQNKPTVNFAGWSSKSETAIKGDVLRVFGQILGLELEHRNTNFNPDWNGGERRVKGYWTFEIEDIDWAELKKYVFDPLNAAQVTQTAYDPGSIMAWPFPDNVLVNTPVITANTELSSNDIALVKQLYPDNPRIVLRGSDKAVTISLITNKPVAVDWGGGWQSRPEIYSSGSKSSISYGFFDDRIEYIVRIYGDSDAINKLGCYNTNGCTFTKIELAANTNLKELDCANHKITTLDVSGCINLQSVNCAKTPLVTDPLYTENLKSFARTLPSSGGTLYIGTSAHPNAKNVIVAICAAKNWTINNTL